jgi:hypothetical protein
MKNISTLVFFCCLLAQVSPSSAMTIILKNGTVFHLAKNANLAPPKLTKLELPPSTWC